MKPVPTGQVVNPPARPHIAAHRAATYEAVRKSRHAGETACATNAGRLFEEVGQAVPPASPACGRFLHGFYGRGGAGLNCHIAFLAIAGACFAQTAQDQKPGLTLRTTTTLVQVNVIAHDAKGRAVTDLKEEDFQVFDNGQEQKIVKFASDTAEAATAVPKASAPTAFSDDKIAPPEQDHGYAVVVLDYLNSGLITGMRSLVEIERLLKAFDPTSRLALYALNDDGLIEAGDFGADRQALLARVSKVIGQPSPCPDNFGVAVSEVKDLRRAGSRCGQGLFLYLYQRDLKTVDMLERFADRLSFTPGRKALVWVTTASDVHSVSDLIKAAVPDAYEREYPLPRMPDLDARFENAIRKLNNADVAIYTVDPCAICGKVWWDPVEKKLKGTCIVEGRVMCELCWSHTEVLEDFAKRTGGRAIPPTNDIAGALQSAAEDVRTSYSLAFYAPPDVDLTKFHQLRVQVNRPGVKLSYRQGYSLGTALTAASLAKELPGAGARALRLKALAAPAVFKELESLAAAPVRGSVGASMTVPYFCTGPNVAVVDLAMQMNVDRLQFKQVDGKQTAELNIAADAVRPDGAIAAKFTDTVKLSFATEAEAAAFLKQPYRYERQFRLAPGKYSVRVAFGSAATGLGRTEAPLTVDAWDGKALALSGVALARETRKADAVSAAMTARKTLVSRGLEFLPAGSVRFKRGEPCKAYFEIRDPSRGAANAPTLSAQLRVLDETGAQKVDSGAFAVDGLAKPGEQTIPVSLSVPVDALAPGKYKLEVSAMRAGSDAVRRVVDFEVEE